jgi:tRNA(Arg) A34 adenosine deaminase TadA
MEPCLMCASTIVIFRVGEVHYAAADPMFDGLHDAMGGLPYCADRMPRRQGPLAGRVGAFAWLLPVLDALEAVWAALPAGGNEQL